MRSTIFLATSLATLASVALSAPAAAQGEGPRFEQRLTFDIPAAELRSGISRFSRVTGVQVVVAPAAVLGRRTGGVSGAHSVREALDMLLQGTGLTPSFHGDIAVLRPGGAPSRQPVALPVRQASPPADTAQAVAGATDDPDPAAEEIVVKGYRESLARAQQLKRDAVGSEEDILAQDIAAFPDLNLAESIQRVPGVTITRDTGEGRQITLRGLGADFTRTQLNGMEVLGNTASGMDNRGAVSRTRSFDFSLFASELFDRVSVQKSYAAEQDEGGIAGTVALSTAKPFDYPGSKFVVSVKGQTNDQTSGVTPRAVALASGRWGDFGALVSVAYSEIKNTEYGYRNWGWNTVVYGPNNIGPNVDPATRTALLGTLTAPNTRVGTVYVPQAESPSTWYTDRKRLGVTTALQYHPGDSLKIDADFLYGRLWDYRDDYALATAGSNALTGGTVNGTQVIQSGVIDSTNTLRAATISGVDLRSEHHIVQNHTDFYQGVLSAEWKASDRLTFSALGGYEESDFRQPVFDKVFMEAKNVTLGYDDRPALPTNSYSIDLTNPDLWAVQRLDVQENAITNRYANGKLAAAWKAEDGVTLKVGGEYKHFINSGYIWVNKVFHNVPADVQVPNSDKMGVGRDTLYDYIVGDVDSVYAALGDNRDLTASNLQAGSDYNVDEKTWAGFAQVDVDTYLANMRLRMNAGVRYFSTELTSSGHLTATVDNATALVPVTVTTDTHNWLPAVNIALDLRPDLVLRASANRNVSRPALGDLAAAGTLTTRPNGGSASFGNPYLKPYMATSLEGSLEWYMDRTGFASLGFFYKHMDSFIITSTHQAPYSTTGLPASLLVQGETPDTLFDISGPINGPGAEIKGIEVAVQHDFTFLPGVLKHLGMVANGTWFDGHQYGIVGTQTVRIPLYNLSKWAANATLYYENKLWGVRVSDAYRSRYITSLGSGGNIGDGVRGTNNVDFQAHYNITPSLRVVAEGINITNEPIQQFTDLTADRTEVYTTSGRVFTFGVTAEF